MSSYRFWQYSPQQETGLLNKLFTKHSKIDSDSHHYHTEIYIFYRSKVSGERRIIISPSSLIFSRKNSYDKTLYNYYSVWMNVEIIKSHVLLRWQKHCSHPRPRVSLGACVLLSGSRDSRDSRGSRAPEGPWRRGGAGPGAAGGRWWFTPRWPRWPPHPRAGRAVAPRPGAVVRRTPRRRRPRGRPGGRRGPRRRGRRLRRAVNLKARAGSRTTWTWSR